MRATLLIFVRHGDTQLSANNILCGSLDVPLNSEGRRQIERLARALSDVPVDVAVSSPLLRCRQSAEILLRDRDVPLRIRDSLAEQDLGVWEGRSFSAIRNHEIDYIREPHRFPFDGGESTEQFWQRVLDGFNDIVREVEGSSALIVSHSGPIRTILTQLFGLDLKRDFFRFWIDTGSATAVHIGRTGPRLIFSNYRGGRKVRIAPIHLPRRGA